jgi:hypothetical protein
MGKPKVALIKICVLEIAVEKLRAVKTTIRKLCVSEIGALELGVSKVAIIKSSCEGIQVLEVTILPSGLADLSPSNANAIDLRDMRKLLSLQDYNFARLPIDLSFVVHRPLCLSHSSTC